jgi:hypothetical protein
VDTSHRHLSTVLTKNEDLENVHHMYKFRTLLVHSKLILAVLKKVADKPNRNMNLPTSYLIGLHCPLCRDNIKIHSTQLPYRQIAPKKKVISSSIFLLTWCAKLTAFEEEGHLRTTYVLVNGDSENCRLSESSQSR